MSDYWVRQTNEDPLYEDILWSRPQSKAGAGKLTIIGGNLHGFGAPGMAYTGAHEAGVGVSRVVLPDAIKKVVHGLLPDADFAPSTPSGSFSKQSLTTMIEHAHWGEACLIAGDIGRNSETAVVLERFAEEYRGPLCVTQDAVDYFKETPLQIVDRPDTLIVLSLSQLQKIFISTPTITPITTSMSAQQLVSALHDYSQVHPATIVTLHNDQICIAHGGQVVTHPHAEKIWRVNVATWATVFWLQNPTEPLKSVATSLIRSAD